MPTRLPESGSGGRRALDEEAVRRFERKYARATDYADVLGRSRNDAMQFLSSHGIQNLVRGGPKGVTALVERRAVQAVFGKSVETHRHRQTSSSSDRFWTALKNHLRKHDSVFHVVAKGPLHALLRSGDGRTVFTIALRPQSSGIALYLEVDPQSTPRRCRVLENQRHQLELLDPSLEWFTDKDSGRRMLGIVIDTDIAAQPIDPNVLRSIDERINRLRNFLGRREHNKFSVDTFRSKSEPHRPF